MNELDKIRERADRIAAFAMTQAERDRATLLDILDTVLAQRDGTAIAEANREHLEQFRNWKVGDLVDEAGIFSKEAVERAAARIMEDFNLPSLRHARQEARAVIAALKGDGDE